MDKLSQDDAADTLQGYRDRAALDWQRYKDGQKPLGQSWKPVMTAQQTQEHAKYVADNKLPF